MKSSQKLGAIALAVILAGCGGGGGGGSSAPAEATLSGFAAKGTLQFATVTAYAVDANGKAATTPSGKAVETDKDGNYTLTGLTTGQKYVVKVTATDKTVHLDEATDSPQKLSGDFVLSAVAEPTAAATTVSVTPFSHQMVVAAQQAGGLTTDNVAKARAVVTEIIGFDPLNLAKNDTSTSEGKQLKVMLTAVSQMAKDGALGCSAAPDKTVCVTDKLAKSTSTTSLKLSLEGGVDVSSTFRTAIVQSAETVRAKDPTITSAVLTNVLNKLECSTACTPVAKPVDNTTAVAVTAIKKVIDEIRTDLTTLFSSDGYTAQSTGKVNAQALKFKQALETVQLDFINQTQLDLRALIQGAQLLRDAKSGASTTVSVGFGAGDLRVFWGLNPSTANAGGCSLYKDEALTQAVSASEAKLAGFVGCSGRFARVVAPPTTTSAINTTTFLEWRHRIAMTPDATTAGKFTYKASAVRTDTTCPGAPAESNYGQSTSCTRSNVPLVKDSSGKEIVFEGTFTLADTAVKVAGDLPPSFIYTPPSFATAASSATVNSSATNSSVLIAIGSDADKLTWDINATVDSIDPVTKEAGKVSLDGSFDRYKGSAKVSSLILAKGSAVDGIAKTIDLDLGATSYTANNIASLRGVLAVGRPVKDKSGTKLNPTSVKFTGALTNTNPSTKAAVDFLQGSLTLAVSDYDKFDASKPESATNTSNVDVEFKGSLTAPDQPRLELVFGTSGKSFDVDATASAASLNFNRWKGTTKTGAVSMAFQKTAASGNTPASNTVTITEAGSGLSMTLTEGVATADVFANGNKVGVFNKSKGLITFTDGTVVSVDFGL
jgi:hypothetical protein